MKEQEKPGKKHIAGAFVHEQHIQTILTIPIYILLTLHFGYHYLGTFHVSILSTKIENLIDGCMLIIFFLISI